MITPPEKSQDKEKLRSTRKILPSGKRRLGSNSYRMYLLFLCSLGNIENQVQQWLRRIKI
jgi:hypothetical protein